MRCIALLSGGKDSVAAIDVARGHGWEVVVALVLRPADDDSFMFHTPNLDVVPAIGAALGLPVHEVPVRAGASHELEDLHAGLAACATEYKADAVISGALASEYQRTRIDRLAHDIGIRSFAPLWHKDPEAYLEGFRHGYDIRFARVAADGLTADLVGTTMDESAVARLLALRMHPAGEGGEYESIVLDAPGFRQRIVVDAARVDASASRATWHITAWHADAKD